MTITDAELEHIFASVPGAGWCTPEKRRATAEVVKELKPNLVVEIGTYGGGWLLPVCFMEPRPFWCNGIDPYSGPKCVEGATTKINIEWWGNQRMLDEVYENLMATIAKLELKNIIIHRAPSEDRAVHFVDGCIDVFHSDANHALEPTLRNAKLYLPKIRVGGVFIQDDIRWEEEKDGVRTRTVEPTIRWLLENGCERMFEVSESLFLRKIR